MALKGLYFYLIEGHHKHSSPRNQIRNQPWRLSRSCGIGKWRSETEWLELRMSITLIEHTSLFIPIKLLHNLLLLPLQVGRMRVWRQTDGWDRFTWWDWSFHVITTCRCCCCGFRFQFRLMEVEGYSAQRFGSWLKTEERWWGYDRGNLLAGMILARIGEFAKNNSPFSFGPFHNPTHRTG